MVFVVDKNHFNGDGQSVHRGKIASGFAFLNGEGSDIVTGNLARKFQVSLILVDGKACFIDKLVLQRLCKGLAQGRVDHFGPVPEIIDENGLHIR